MSKVRSAPRTTRRLFALLAFCLTSAVVPMPAVGAAQLPAGTYIVVLREDVVDPGSVAAEHAAGLGVEVMYLYQHALKGYAATMPSGLAEMVAADPRVAYVEPDGVMFSSTTQTGATLGLDRIDQRYLPLSTTYTYTSTGSGVKAYIIDTGIRFGHSQFGGRAVSGYDAVDGGSADDCNGHGTHVAGTVGGSTYGVAKSVTLVGVRVLNCSGSGTTSGVIAGIDWVTGNHLAGQPAVANMSLGGGASTSLDSAVKRSIGDGVSYAIAAGNGNAYGVAQNACNYSPARVAEAMTISATEKTDKKASWANYGTCVDWFAPGVSITSAWHTSTTATRTISGTSMATPHTAGVAALYLQTNRSASPSTVRSVLYNLATKGIVTSSSTTNNHLLYTNL
jgi:subtilisin family serine protease